MPAGTPVLSLRDVEKTRAGQGRRFALAIPALDLHPGQALALTGESGSGKSTLLELAGLAASPDRAARFLLAGTEVTALPARGRARALAALRAGQIGFVLQTGALLPFLSVSGNALLAQDLAGRRDPGHLALLLERLGLGALGAAMPADLSVGQRQRAAIARALAHRPRLILADEPTAALDPPNKRRVLDLFLALAAETGAALLMATHETALAAGRGMARVDLRVTDGAAGPEARLGKVEVDA